MLPIFEITWLAGVSIWLFCFLVAGDAVVLALRLPALNPISRTGLSFAFGIGIQTSVWFWCSLIGLPLNQELITWSTGIACCAWLSLKRYRNQPAASWPELNASAVAGLGLLVLNAMYLLAISVTEPLSSWDARSHWGLSARLFFYDQSVYSPGLIDPARLHPHPEYPLLFPLSQWAFFSIVGNVDDHWVHVTAPFFYLALVAICWTARGSEAWKGLAALPTLMISGLPLLVSKGFAHTAEADVPLSMFMAGHVVLLLGFFKSGRPNYLVGACLMAAFAIMTKSEGLALVALSLCGVVCAMWKKQLEGQWRILGAASALLFGLVLPWGIFSKYFLPARGISVNSLSGSDALQIFWASGLSFAKAYAAQLLDPFTWGFFWWLVFIVLLTGFADRALRTTTEFRYLAVLIVGYLFLLVWVWGSKGSYATYSPSRTTLALAGPACYLLIIFCERQAGSATLFLSSRPTAILLALMTAWNSFWISLSFVNRSSIYWTWDGWILSKFLQASTTPRILSILWTVTTALMAFYVVRRKAFSGPRVQLGVFLAMALHSVMTALTLHSCLIRLSLKSQHQAAWTYERKRHEILKYQMATPGDVARAMSQLPKNCEVALCVESRNHGDGQAITESLNAAMMLNFYLQPRRVFLHIDDLQRHSGRCIVRGHPVPWRVKLSNGTITVISNTAR